MDWAVALLPIGLQVLAFKLIGRDKNTTGFDDAMGQVLIDMSPVIPELIQGRTLNDSAADRTMLAIFKTSESYLRQRGKLPGQTDPAIGSVGNVQ